MTIEIARESADRLDDYSSISIAFWMAERLRVESLERGLGGIALTLEPVELPRWYDYDKEDEPPSGWTRWNLDNWGFFAAYADGQRVGGATVARDTAGVYMLEGRPDLACLWDIRVAPEWRGRGVGRELLASAAAWAAGQGSRTLKIETQNINVAACRFYASQGCQLEGVHPMAYPHDPQQVQLLWYMALGATPRPVVPR